MIYDLVWLDNLLMSQFLHHTIFSFSCFFRFSMSSSLIKPQLNLQFTTCSVLKILFPRIILHLAINFENKEREKEEKVFIQLISYAKERTTGRITNDFPRFSEAFFVNKALNDSRKTVYCLIIHLLIYVN